MKTVYIPFNERFGAEEICAEMKMCSRPEFLEQSDDQIPENSSFEYKMVIPDNAKYGIDGKLTSYIFLFHGLNERSWQKYDSWAERLAQDTARAVIMFPIAFHMNRSPKEWNNPRAMQCLVNSYLTKGKNLVRLSFLNFALSYRIKADPYRFYLSGKETINNVCQLIDQIKSGEHSYISAEAEFDIFAYSIGALLSQVMLQADPFNYFSTSRLFMFCGGSIFSKMNGESKMIMDKESFDLLKEYYLNHFVVKLEQKGKVGRLEQSFISLIDERFYKEKRESFYESNYPRIKVISLLKDIVIPTHGIKSALGKRSNSQLEEMDFPYKYSHEMPFPELPDNELSREYCFRKVFASAADFLV